jgi:hypothetical protein
MGTPGGAGLPPVHGFPFARRQGKNENVRMFQ